MATINHIRLARLNSALAYECEQGHRLQLGGHPYGRPTLIKTDAYTRRSNICRLCFTARATGTGECLCD